MGDLISIFPARPCFLLLPNISAQELLHLWECSLLGGLLKSEIPAYPSPFITLQQIFLYLRSELSEFINFQVVTLQNLILNAINQKNTLVAV